MLQSRVQKQEPLLQSPTVSPDAQALVRRRSPAGSADRASSRVLRRADAADFAAAMDLDGAFAAPRDHATPGVRTITLTRSHDPLDERGEADAPGWHGDDDAPGWDGRDDAHGWHAHGHADATALMLSPAARPGHRRPPRTSIERLVDTPDRIALMAVALGVLLVIIAAATSATA